MSEHDVKSNAWMCRHKRLRFPDLATGEGFVGDNPQKFTKPVRVYRCDICTNFHVTSHDVQENYAPNTTKGGDK